MISRFFAEKTKSSCFPRATEHRRYCLTSIRAMTSGSLRGKSVFGVKLHREHALPGVRVPVFAREFHLRQLRHRGRLDRSQPPCYSWRAWKR